jgi:ATP-dependent DNA ligase
MIAFSIAARRPCPLNHPQGKPVRHAPRNSEECIGSRPKLVAEVTFLSWADDGLLRQVVFQGLREDGPASDVRLDRPSPS